MLSPSWKLYGRLILLALTLVACGLVSPDPELPPASRQPQPADQPPTADTPIVEQSIEQPDATVGSVPTGEPVTWQEVRFPSGETGIAIEDELGPLGVDRYQLYAERGQSITIRISSPDEDLGYTAFGLGDLMPLVQMPVADSLTYALPESQDYAINVFGSQGASYTLTLELPPLPEVPGCAVETSGDFPYGYIDPIAVYTVSSTTSTLYTELASANTSFELVLQTSDGWLGLDTGVTGDQGNSRLRWINPGPETTSINGACIVPEVLSFDSLANATFDTELYQVTLTDGKTDILEGGDGAGVIRHFRLSQSVEYGDLDGDGTMEALVRVINHTGGTGQNFDLLVFASDEGRPRHITSLALGDRPLIRDIVVNTEGVVELDLTEIYTHLFTPCCDTQDIKITFVLEDGDLIQVIDDQESM